MGDPERTAEMVGTRTMTIGGEPTDMSATNDRYPGKGKQTGKVG